MTAPDTTAIGNAALQALRPDPSWFDWRPARIVFALAGDWALIALAFVAAVHWPHPLVYLGAAVLIARSQLALAVLMHEAAHGLFWRGKRANDALAQVFAAGPLYLSLVTYRAGHLQHHLAPMKIDDPVAVVFGVGDYPIPRWRLALRLLGDVCGVAYCISAFRIARGDYREVLRAPRKSAGLKWFEAGSMLATNGALFGALAWAGHPWFYLGLWILPAVTLLTFMGRMRAIMEHAGLPEDTDQSRNARTIVRPSWQTFLFGPHAIHYHIEHHLYARVPFYRLGAVHRALAAQGLLPTANLYRGYGGVLRDVSYSGRDARG